MSLFERAKKAKENKKGFTLVELIVVLVILAILAAIMVPALTSWIDRAKTKQVLVDARSVYLAAQTLASEEYAKTSPQSANITKSKIASLAGVGGATGSKITFSPSTTGLDSKYKVIKIGYTDGTYYAEWAGGKTEDKKWHIYEGTVAADGKEVQ